MEFKEKVVAYMQEKRLTLEGFAKEANLHDFAEFKRHFDKEVWDRYFCAFMREELGDDFGRWKLKSDFNMSL